MTDAPDTPEVTTVRDHPFFPDGEWWERCKCGLGEAAHLTTTQPPGGWPPDYGKTGNAEPPDDSGPEPELPLPSPHEINLMDVMYGQYGEMCPRCGGMMQRTGSCLTCGSCGNNTGCG